MGKEEVLGALETDLANPGSYKSGEYLFQHALARLKKMILIDRNGVIDALNTWILMRSEPYTTLSVDLVKELHLVELLPTIRLLKKEVEKGDVFKKFYVAEFEKVINYLENCNNNEH